MAKIRGLTYIAGDSLFTVNEWGGYQQTAPMGATSAPVTVGHISDSDFRVYVGNFDGTVSLFNTPFPVLPDGTFVVGQGVNILWSLAHADGVLYVGTGTPDGAGGWTGGSMSALDDAAGTVLWSQGYSFVVEYPASIVYSGGTASLVVFGVDGTLRALEVASGNEVWQESASPFGQYVHDQVVYYADIADNTLRARSTADGSQVWEYTNPDGANFQPPIVAGGVLYTTSEASQVVSLEAATGNLLWEAESAAPYPGIPTTHFDHSRGLALLSFATGQYSIGNSYLQALDANSGAPVWLSTTDVGGPGEACTTPIIAGWIGTSTGEWAQGQLVQVGTPDGRIVSLDVATGELVWQTQLTTEQQAFTSRPRWAFMP